MINILVQHKKSSHTDLGSNCTS